MGENDVNHSERSQQPAWAAASATPVGKPLQRRGPGPLVWLMLGILGLLALAVVFVLPGIVQEYELPFTPRTDVAERVTPVPIASPTAAISPFEEAQRARQRQQAQEVLAQLLEKQEALESLEVAQWAAQDYAAAIELARRGDEAYRTQLFDQATAAYQGADSALASLQDQVSQRLADALSAGEQALAEEDSVRAQEQFTLALLFDPLSTQAQAGLGRAQRLDEVLALMDTAQDQREAGALNQALTTVQQVVALDPEHAPARALEQQIRGQIADNAFTAVMSEGFAALQSGQSEAAIAAFERALTMRPGNVEAQEAITQTRDQLAVAQITAHRGAAENYVAQEQWEEAVREYDAALLVDGNLVFALEGKDYTQKRLQLDRLLQSAVEQPERLADAAVHEQAVQVYYTGRSVQPAGPRLTEQLNALETLLSKAQVPVDVQLVSDNQTEVTLYQVGVLGRFTQQTLSLKPGKYVAVGTRPGYRDVRTEFEVGFDNRSASVTVACTELVAANRR